MRIRTIKPSLWQDEDLATVSQSALLLAIGLLNFCDDEGYFKANPKLIKAAVFPLRDTSANVSNLIEELVRIRYIRLFEGHDRKQYGYVIGFTKHQRINRPNESKIKGLDPSRNNHGAITERSSKFSVGIRNKEKEKEKEKRSKVASATCDYTEDFQKLWKTYPRREGGNPKRRAFRSFNSRIREGHNISEMQEGVKRYKRWVEEKGNMGTRYVMHTATFLGPDCFFQDPWEIHDSDDDMLADWMDGAI